MVDGQQSEMNDDFEGLISSAIAKSHDGKSQANEGAIYIDADDKVTRNIFPE